MYRLLGITFISRKYIHQDVMNMFLHINNSNNKIRRY